LGLPDPGALALAIEPIEPIEPIDAGALHQRRSSQKTVSQRWHSQSLP